MRLIIVSGLSGSGKSVALHMLEDVDFYCVDNIPAALLKAFISHTVRGMGDTYPRTAADLIIDTSNMGVHSLREMIRERIDRRREGRLSLMFESFGYKNGIPGDADFVFDVRSLPNPYWEHGLRHLDGRDAPVIEYLAGHPAVRKMVADVIEFLDRRVGEFAQANRSYLTIAVGCTGGQHRSVYIAEQLAEHFRESFPQVLTRHDSLQKS